MDFGLLSEGFLLPGQDESTRFRETLLEFQAAEAAGFDFVGLSEQHFIAPLCTYSSAEPMYGAIAATTERIRIRTSVILLPYHHPISTAERVATLDILSGGRVELGTGRGNSWRACEGFGLDPAETEGRWRESLEIILQAWTQDEMSYRGQYYAIPPRTVRPRPIQKPHPPVWYAAISPASHERAGKLGLGVMSLTLGVDRSQVARRVQRYHRGQAEAEPIVARPLDRFSVLTAGYVAEDHDAAFREGQAPSMHYLRTLVGFYEEGLKRAGTPVDFTELWTRLEDFPAVVRDGMLMVGDPQDCIRWVKAYEEVGVQEVFLRLEGVPHQKILESIRLFGRYVIPAFKKQPVASEAVRPG